MSNPSYVQVATDGSGKKVVMEQVVAPDGTTQYVQVALISGETADVLYQMGKDIKSLLAVNRALLFTLSQLTNFEVEAEDFEDYRANA